MTITDSSTLRIAASATALLCASVLLTSCDSSNEDGKLTIYSSLPLQGDSRPQSEDVVKAMRLALEQHGGKAGEFTVKYVPLDDATSATGSWDEEKVRANARQAARDPRTIAYLGEFNSGASVASIPLLNEAGILQVSPSNTYVGLTRSDGAEEGEPDMYYPTAERHYGRVVPADHVQAGALVSYMEFEGCTDTFILNDDETYGAGLAGQVERNATDQGLRVLANVAVTPETDVPRLRKRIKAATPDCVFYGGITQNGAAEIANDVGAALPRARLFFGDGCAETAFTEDLEPAVASRVLITNPTLDTKSYPALGQQFFKDFKNAYGTDPEPYAIYGFEAMSAVLDAIEVAGDKAAATPKGRRAVVDAFFKTKDRKSVLGTYSIDAYGDTTLASYGGYKVADGRVAFARVIDVVVAKPVGGPALTKPTATPTSEATTVLEGNWLGGKVTLQTMMKERTEKEAKAVFAANGATSSLVTSLELRGDRWQAFVSADGGPATPAQGGRFTVDGNEIHMIDGSFDYTYRFDLSGDDLAIELVKSNAKPGDDGTSDDAFQFAHYGAPFVRVK